MSKIFTKLRGSSVAVRIFHMQECLNRPRSAGSQKATQQKHEKQVNSSILNCLVGWFPHHYSVY